ncbi:MAG: ceramidase domain-containing protein [Rubrivivax sp.]|nr:ceramidase domain-containing protein [Rubrivivax sp.]
MSPARRHRVRLLAVALLTLAVLLAAALLPPLPQPQRYHDFADQRHLFGLPHAWNLVSNLGFVVVGAFALRRLHQGQASFIDARERWPYGLFFLSVVAVGLGSVYYHLAPSHETLFWDRLPMSVAFMALFSAVLVERLGPRVGLRLFPWLMLAGPLSVVYWLLSERAGAGDLRAYAVVQFYPLLLMPLLMGLFAPRYTRGGDLLLVLALYLAALAADRMDRVVFAAGGWLSGHTLKHLLAALAAAWLWRMLSLRRPALEPSAAEN